MGSAGRARSLVYGAETVIFGKVTESCFEGINSPLLAHLNSATLESLAAWLGGRFEADAGAAGFGWVHQFANGLHQFLDIGVVSLQPVFQFRQLGQYVAISDDGASHAHKSKYNKHAHFNGAFGVQHGRRHDGAVFGKGVRAITRAAVAFT